MKNDLDVFIYTYKRFGIDLTVTDMSGNGEKTIKFGRYEGHDNDPAFEKFGGYSLFYSLVTFDKNGKFISQDFYE